MHVSPVFWIFIILKTQKTPPRPPKYPRNNPNNDWFIHEILILKLEFNLNLSSVGVLQVKHQEVADFLGGRLYDCVIKYKEV